MTENWHQNFKNKNRETLIATAKQLFMKQSFLNVNIKEVCTLANISRVTFYKHFQSMNELIFAVQIEILENMTTTVQLAATPSMNGKERIAAMLQAWVRYAAEHPNYIKFVLLFDLHYEAYDSSGTLKHQYNSFIERAKNQHFLNEALHIGYKDGSLKTDENATETAIFIFTSMMGMLQKMSMLPEGQNDYGKEQLRIANRFVDMLLHHLSA